MPTQAHTDLMASIRSHLCPSSTHTGDFQSLKFQPISNDPFEKYLFKGIRQKVWLDVTIIVSPIVHISQDEEIVKGSKDP